MTEPTSAPKPAELMQQGHKALRDRHYHVAARAFEQAALTGLVEAQYQLGCLFEKGMGVRTDSAKARNLFEKAANNNHPLAAEKMAEFFAEGIGGDRNLEQSQKWKDKAQSLQSTEKKEE